MTSLSSRTRVHRPAESELAGIVIGPEAVIVPETAVLAVAAGKLLPVGLPRGEDARRVLVLRLEQEAGSDLPGRSTANLVEGAAQVSEGWPSVERIDRSRCIGCRRVPS